MSRLPQSPPNPTNAASAPRFDLQFTRNAAAQIRALDGSVRNQLRTVLETKLAVDPEGYGLPMRGPLAGFWKHQFGHHRVIYRVVHHYLVVAVCSVGVRKQGDQDNIYRRLEAVAKTGRLAGQIASLLESLRPPQNDPNGGGSGLPPRPR